MKTSIRLKIVILAMLVLSSQGCSLMESRVFVNPNADFSFYKRVGMLTFRNYSEDKLAGEKMSDVFMTEILIGGKLDVMDRGQLHAVVAQIAKTNAPIEDLDFSPGQLTQIGEFAKVQGIFVGTINDYKMVMISGDQYPYISMTVKFIDAPTGTVAWQYRISATGGPHFPVMSIGDTYTLASMSQQVCEKIVKDFYRKAVLK